MTARLELQTRARDGHAPSAVVPLRRAQELQFTARRSLHHGAKTAIARSAVDLVHDDMTIALSAGTTTWAVARQLRDRRGLRFLTNSPNVGRADPELLERLKTRVARVVLADPSKEVPSDPT
ncbi:MAG: hypothetical protein MSC30_15660 [Gaiellaceae bacterium MAG52_C11]|nr:hypothetical protein [Candidatus Gaiellasilicea maunaloa]